MLYLFLVFLEGHLLILLIDVIFKSDRFLLLPGNWLPGSLLLNFLMPDFITLSFHLSSFILSGIFISNVLIPGFRLPDLTLQIGLLLLLSHANVAGPGLIIQGLLLPDKWFYRPDFLLLTKMDMDLKNFNFFSLFLRRLRTR